MFSHTIMKNSHMHAFMYVYVYRELIFQNSKWIEKKNSEKCQYSEDTCVSKPVGTFTVICVSATRMSPTPGPWTGTAP